ncbi:MAG: hypothetical protein AB8H79_25195 [Myxococcota bacterium]
MTLRPFLLSTVLFPLAALAGTALGNPVAGILLVDGADVHVQDVIATPCNTTTPDSFVILDTLQVNQSSSFQLFNDTYCDMIINVRWSPGGPLVAVPVSGFDELDVDPSGATITIELDESAGTATFTQ